MRRTVVALCFKLAVQKRAWSPRSGLRGFVGVKGISQQLSVPGLVPRARLGSVGSEVARSRAGHRPPLKLHVRFSRMQLSRRHQNSEMQEKGNSRVDLSCTRQIESSRQDPRTMTYGFFAKRTDPPSSSLLIWLLVSPFLSSPATFPDPLWSPITRSRGFHRASGTIWQSDY